MAQRKADGTATSRCRPWYHWTHNGVDFITLDNAEHGRVLGCAVALAAGGAGPRSGSRTRAFAPLLPGMHESLPHSTSSDHAMDDWDLGIRTGELVYTWLYDAQAAGKHVYIMSSHSHYYSPNIYNTAYWTQHTNDSVAGHHHRLARERIATASAGSRQGVEDRIYGYLQGTVHADGTIDFALHELSERDLVEAQVAECAAGKDSLVL